jgi:hypothetical protein
MALIPFTGESKLTFNPNWWWSISHLYQQISLSHLRRIDFCDNNVDTERFFYEGTKRDS